MNALLTGSRVYGVPREDSDVDLVLLVSETELNILKTAADTVNVQSTGGSAEESPAIVATLRIGRLNILACATQWQFDLWVKGTKHLLEENTITGQFRSRERAVEVFQALEQGKPIP